MAVDAMSAGSVPFMGLDLTQNMDAYIKVFDQILAYDFDVLVAGHHNNPSTRDDVRIATVNGRWLGHQALLQTVLEPIAEYATCFSVVGAPQPRGRGGSED
jgi:hypothetical protein